MLKTAAVFIGSQVAQRAEKGIGEISVSAVQFENAKTGTAGALRRVDELLYHICDLLLGQLVGHWFTVSPG